LTYTSNYSQSDLTQVLYQSPVSTQMPIKLEHSFDHSDSQVQVRSLAKLTPKLNPTPKSTQLSSWPRLPRQPYSQVDGELQVDSNWDDDVKCQIKLNQIKAQIEAEKYVKINVWLKVKMGGFSINRPLLPLILGAWKVKRNIPTKVKNFVFILKSM